MVMTIDMHADAQAIVKGEATYTGQKSLILTGEWEFYWDTLFSASHVEPITKQYIPVPGLWNKWYPYQGKASYRLVLTSNKNYPIIGAYVPATFNSSAVYVNGQLVSQNGHMAENLDEIIPKWIPELVVFPLRKGANEIIWQMANRYHSKAGTNKSIEIGSHADLLAHREMRIAVNVFLVGCVTILGLFFFGLHLYWNKNLSTLYLGLSFLCLGVYFAFFDLHLLNKLLAEVSWQITVRGEYVSLYASALFFALFIHSFYPEKYNVYVLRTIKIYLIGFMALICATPVSFFSSLHNYSLIIIGGSMLYAVYIIVQAFINKKISGLLATTILATTLGSPILIILVYLGWLPYIPFLEDISTLLCILAFSFVMAVRFAGQFSVAERLQIEAVEQNRIIMNSLKEKEVLLAEIHHRVKNNLQTITSLLNMQSRATSNEEILEAFKQGQGRVKAISLIHQTLYQSDNLTEIDFKGYTNQLIGQLNVLYKNEAEQCQAIVEIKDIRLDIDTAIPLGLILNELISNAYKYAFSKVENGQIRISLTRKTDDWLELMTTDNGIGLPTGFKVETTKTLGLKLVNILTKQLGGTLTYIPNNGSHFIVRFKEIKPNMS